MVTQGDGGLGQGARDERNTGYVLKHILIVEGQRNKGSFQSEFRM